MKVQQRSGDREAQDREEQLFYRGKKLLGYLAVLVGTVLAVYVGIWLMVVKPLMALYVSWKLKKLHWVLVLIAFIKCRLSLTVLGLIWSIGYMIKCILDE